MDSRRPEVSPTPISVVHVDPAHLEIAKEIALGVSSLILSVEPQAGVDLTLIVCKAPGEDRARTWLQGLPRDVLLEQKIAGPELAADLDQVAEGGDRPLLILIYEHMDQRPVATMAAGLGVRGFTAAGGAA